MIVVNGGTDKVKAEMKKAAAAITDEIKGIKTKYKKEKGKKLPRDAEVKIEALEHRKSMYGISYILPVRVGEIVINFKLYETFMKKIKDFQIDMTISDKCVQVVYRKEKTQGILVLEDMSSYFEWFVHIPLASVKENGA